MNTQKIKAATFEAIYWWNRDEHYYHNYFSKLDEIYESKPLLAFFTNKIFDTFLRAYSVRRNLYADYPIVDLFITKLIEKGFVSRVKRGDIDILDSVSDEIKFEGILSDKRTVSLLSKVAFLVNPHIYPLYDSQAKKGLWKIINQDGSISQYQIERYSGFYSHVSLLNDRIANQGLFDVSSQTLSFFKNTPAFHFFTENPKAFELRVVDKLLWIEGQNPEQKRRESHNEAYLDFMNLYLK